MSSRPQTSHSLAPLSVKLEPLAMDPALFTLPTPSSTEYVISLPNRISSLYFWADGMVPLSVDVDRHVGVAPPVPMRTFLHFRVTMPPVADLRCPPNLQGINGAVSFANPWTSLAKCHTKSWGEGRTVVSQDLGLFTQVPVPELQVGLGTESSSSQLAYAYLPESALTRCHWLQTGLSHSVHRTRASNDLRLTMCTVSRSSHHHPTARRRQRGSGRPRLPHPACS